MKLNRDKVEKLMDLYFGGCYNRFARELEVDPSQLYRFIKSGRCAGNKLIGAIIRFCKSRGLDYEGYLEI